MDVLDIFQLYDQAPNVPLKYLGEDYCDIKLPEPKVGDHVYAVMQTHVFKDMDANDPRQFYIYAECETVIESFYRVGDSLFITLKPVDFYGHEFYRYVVYNDWYKGERNFDLDMVPKSLVKASSV